MASYQGVVQKYAKGVESSQDHYKIVNTVGMCQAQIY